MKDKVNCHMRHQERLGGREWGQEFDVTLEKVKTCTMEVGKEHLKHRDQCEQSLKSRWMQNILGEPWRGWLCCRESRVTHDWGTVTRKG